jgi:hypothetical protein
VDLRNFIHGDDRQKDEYVAAILAHSIAYTTTLIRIIDRWVDELPPEMIDELSSSIDNFIGMVGEFVDVDSMYKAIDETIGEEDNDSAA